ncbi:Aldehyde oxidase and xanthine dehydrogenase molybdopterin binding protein [uncultured spirochete]|uniref:Aldehyde oxidase and xanthine dehydrogenase molybdopterin binding protein n=1 Tax=uncultured spirochete TaxID=156406 RepID=A0A3P3XV17_9SPIR|nr:Aldehyde oxidase and xanthine dehydrogenase molybdopterin binding protein [uncultured spirochete]
MRDYHTPTLPPVDKPLEATEKFNIVAHDVSKVDGEGLVLGRPAYADDLAPQNALHVKLVRSPHAFARILSIDPSEALALPGVACVLTWKDCPRIPITRAGQGNPEPSPHDRFILDEYVRYVGDEVAVVAAESEAIAEKAAPLVKVEYEVLKPVLDFEKALDNPIVIHPEPEIHEMFPIGFEPARNIAAAYHMEIGDVEKEIAASPVAVETTVYTQAQQHVALEPHTAFSYFDVQGRLVIVTSTQNPWHTRRLLGLAFQMPLRQIRIVKPRIGGGFGGKQHIHVEPYVAMVTMKTGRPARLALTRREVFEATFTRHEMRVKVRLGADQNGMLRAIDMQVLSNTGAYGEHALTTFMVAGSKTLPLYNKAVAVRFGGHVVYTNKVSAGALRGYGAIQGLTGLESAMDELAHKLKMDPVELRRKNMLHEGETSEVFRIMGEGTEGVAMIIESCKLEECIARGKELIGWDPGNLVREIAPGKVRAKGMAIAMQGSGIPLVDMGSARIELQDGGFFKLHVGATDLGTGSDTILAQIAAEELGVDMKDIVIHSSDTDHTPFDVGAYASSTTYVSGSAVLKAARSLKTKLIEAVAEKLGVAPEGIIYKDKIFRTLDGTKTLSLDDFSYDTLYHDGAKMQTLEATESFTGDKSPPPYLAAFVEIELDVETGKVDVVNYVAVADVGTPINPNLTKIQIEGGLLQGIGMALYEDVRYSEAGHMLSHTMMTYPIPSREDVGRITVELVNSYEPSGPFGAKSAGEIGIDTPPAAIANAIRNAVGIRLTEYPFTPERVLMAIRAAEKKQRPL